MVLIALFAADRVGCSSGPAANQLDQTVTLLEGALNVRYGTEYDGTVTYQLSEQFPATATIAQLDRRLDQAGWVQTDEDVFNPGRSRPGRAWALLDTPEGTHFSWTARWREAGGNILLFNFQYRVESIGGRITPQTPLNVTVIRFSTATADAIRQANR